MDAKGDTTLTLDVDVNIYGEVNSSFLVFSALLLYGRFGKMMSTYLFAFERIWAQTFIYLAFIPVVLYYVRAVAPQILTYALLIASTFYYGKLAICAIAAERYISAHGSRAPRIPDYYPFGLGTLFRALYYFTNWRNHEFWWKIFSTHGNPKNPYTVESICLGQRLMFTADEENIKAILATQFQDFGKGPQFRKEWKDFLGLSMCCSCDAAFLLIC